MQDLIAGRIDYQCPNAPAAIPQLEGKLVKAIAILTKDRSPVLPNLASAHEQGLKDFEVDNWLAFFLPKGTPAAIIRKLNDATVAAMDRPVGAGAAAGTRRRSGRARAPVARISPELRRARNQEVGRNHQGEWTGDELRIQGAARELLTFKKKICASVNEVYWSFLIRVSTIDRKVMP